MTNEELVPFTFRFGGDTVMMPKSLVDSMNKSYQQHDLEMTPGYVKLVKTKEEIFRGELRYALVYRIEKDKENKNHDLVYFHPETKEAFEYWYNDEYTKKEDLNVSLIPVEYIEFHRWARGMDL